MNNLLSCLINLTRVYSGVNLLFTWKFIVRASHWHFTIYGFGWMSRAAAENMPMQHVTSHWPITCNTALVADAHKRLSWIVCNVAECQTLCSVLVHGVCVCVYCLAWSIAPLPLSTLQTLCSWFSIIERVSRSGRVFPWAQLLLVSFNFFTLSTVVWVRIVVFFLSSLLSALPDEISDNNLWLTKNTHADSLTSTGRGAERRKSERISVSWVYVVMNGPAHRYR